MTNLDKAIKALERIAELRSKIVEPFIDGLAIDIARQALSDLSSNKLEPGDVENRRAHSIEVHALLLLRALDRYGFPVSEPASTAGMSIEERDLHNAARRLQRVVNSDWSVANEPAMTNGQ